ncbi:MAG: DUF1643 domain-containing protein [Terriglobales bacterium]
MNPTIAGQASAVLSECQSYRYSLVRDWGSGERLSFIMLNPSTADAVADDPTIRRCCGFARSNFYTGVHVVNLFALRATAKTALTRVGYSLACGQENDRYLRAAIGEAAMLVAAWGAHDGELGLWVKQRVAEVRAMCGQAGRPLWCLGRAKSGAPRHPLYLPQKARLEVWTGV